jgi:DNA repair exonuclease SbcCD ATPase subunit
MESKLPKDIQDKINAGAYAHAANMYPNFQKEREKAEKQFISGAAAWAIWKVKYDELESANLNLQMEHMLLKQQHQQLKERCDKMEAALKQIEQMSDPGDYWTAVCRMKSIASDALSWKEGKEVRDGD